MHSNTFLVRAATQWLVHPTHLPTIRRRCRTCPSTEFRTQGRFRVNANHKLLDVWLLALCTQCGETAKLTVLERAHVRSIEPAMLSGFHDNAPGLAAKLLADPQVAHRNDVALDWADAWTLQTSPGELPKADILEVGVRFAQRIPLRPTTLIATGLGLSGAEVAKHIAAGRISSGHKLSGRRAGDFSFVFDRTADAHVTASAMTGVMPESRRSTMSADVPAVVSWTTAGSTTNHDQKDR